jgi:hypothetical protein
MVDAQDGSQTAWKKVGTFFFEEHPMLSGGADARLNFSDGERA